MTMLKSLLETIRNRIEVLHLAYEKAKFEIENGFYDDYRR